MREDFDPKGKGYLLGTHILDKGFQAGSLVGALIVVPLTAYRLSRSGKGDILRVPSGLAVQAPWLALFWQVRHGAGQT